MHIRAYVLLILTALLWGANAVAGKLAIGHISPMTLTALRWLFSLIILTAIYGGVLRSDLSTLKRSWPILAFLGAFGFTLFNVSFYTALYYTSAINVSIEQGGIPMLVFLLNFLFFRLKATIAQVIGLVLSMAGVALTASHGELAHLASLTFNFGDVLMLGAIVMYAFYTVCLRFRPAISWQSVMIAMCFFAFLASVPFAIGEYMRGQAHITDAQGWLVLAFVVLGPSIVSQAMYIMGISLIGANRASLFVNLVPIFGTLLSIVLLGEEFHLYHALALLLVFGGIWLAERRVSAPRIAAR